MLETAPSTLLTKRPHPGREFAAKNAALQPAHHGSRPSKRVRVNLESEGSASPLSPMEVETLFADAGVQTPSFLLYPNNAVQRSGVVERVERMSVGSVLALAAMVEGVVRAVHARRSGAGSVQEPDRLPVKCPRTLGVRAGIRQEWETPQMERDVWQRVAEMRGAFHPGTK